MKRVEKIVITFKCLLFLPCLLSAQSKEGNSYTRYVKPLIGTYKNGQIAPVVVVPFGMVQIGPDTYNYGSGYKYDAKSILGFSHTHKSGGGCNDLQDILFQPTTGKVLFEPGVDSIKYSGYRSSFSHAEETAKPGFYAVRLLDYNVRVSLTASEHCAYHRYEFPNSDSANVIIDLKHGSNAACTVFPEHDKDTILTSGIKLEGTSAVSGFRISSGWAPRQAVYFYAEFSMPFTIAKGYTNKQVLINPSDLNGSDIRMALTFKTFSGKPVFVRIGISAVSIEAARTNLEAEIAKKDFEQVKKECEQKWENELRKIQVKGGTRRQREILYTGIYHSLMYPMISSDVDGKYRGADQSIHIAEGYKHYSGVMGLWDVFRASLPLLTLLRPEVANDHVRTMLEHYKQSGLLPFWVLWGNETLCMIGYHSMPVIADAYYKGIRNYDVDAVYSAMKSSAMKDSFGIGTIWKKPMGTRNYKQYGYIPAELEDNSVSQTLEYSYDDWCIAQMAKQLGKEEDYSYFLKRAGFYKNVFDSSLGFMRGRLLDGSWKTGFDPVFYDHLKTDFCEGTPWVWTFFVPHDIEGLAMLIGGREKLATKLDSFFTTNQKTKNGILALPLEGVIGQYAHGNEPSHHIPFIYNYLGQPWKTQKYLHRILNSFYNNTPDGICGDDDTGQMSAWYIFGAMGIYPVTHGSGVYNIGTPMFPEMIVRSNSKGREYSLTIRAHNSSPENMYVKRVRLNGKLINRSWLEHYELFGKNSMLEFEMSPKPDFKRGTSAVSFPESVTSENSK